MANFQLRHVLCAISTAVLSQDDSFCQNNAGNDGPSLLPSLVSGTCGVLASTQWCCSQHTRGAPEQELSEQPHMMHHEVNPALTKVLAEGHPTHFAAVFDR